MRRALGWLFAGVLGGCAQSAVGPEIDASIATQLDASTLPSDDAGTLANEDAATVSSVDALTREDAAAAEDARAPFADAATTPDATVAPDAATTSTTPIPRPVVFIHGIGGSASEFAVMIDRLVADGWPRDYLAAVQFPDPRWGCNADNATLIAQAVTDLLARTGEPRVDLVAHSMGVLSSRHFLKNLGGTALVNTYVTLGGMHHGNRSACLNPLPVCVWEEICPTKPFLTQLNDPPATPGPTTWVSIYSTDDDRVDPSSSELVGAENIEVSGPVHAGPMGVLESMITYPDVRRVLRYPPW